LKSKLLKHLAENISKSEELLQEFVERVRLAYPRSAIILVGSRARGDHLPYSDYDVVVVLEHVDDKLRLIEELRKLKPRGLSLDLIVVSLEEIRTDPIIKQMLATRRVLYDGLGIEKLLQE